MEKILDYLRNAMGFQEPCVCKRDRDSDDDPPVMKKYRTVPNRFPKIMPSDEEEECTSRRPVAEASRIRFIPVTLDKDLPSTSTPSRILEPEKGLVKSLENFDFGRASNLPSSSSNSHWKSSSLFEKPTSISQRQTTLNSESSANSGNLKLKLNLSPKSNLLDGPRQHLQKPVQNKFFNKPAPKLVYKIDYDDDDEDDVYRFASHEPTNRTSYFKNGKKSTKCDDNVEVIEISDSEDYNYFVVKQPKSHKSVSSCNGHNSNRVEDELDEDDNDPCIPNCKNHRTRLSDTTNSYYRRSRSPKMNRDLIERFKYPLSLSKARLLNSYTPFWKSQKKLGIGQATTTQIRTPGRLPETTRAVIEKCIRLDEKKKNEELIKLTTSSFMRKKEEECTSRRPVAEASRIRFIPVTLDKDLPSTSTPSRILEPEKGLVKSLENFDFGRASNLPSSSSNSHWKSSSLFEKPTSISQRQTTLNSESSANSGNLKLKLNLSPKSNLLDGPRQHLQKPVQNKFFNKPAPKLVYKIDYDDDDEDDVYRFASHEPTNRTSYFKNGKKSTKCDDNVEVIEISDSEDYNYFVVKQPKSHKSVSSCNGHNSNRVEDELDEDDNDPCIPNCKNHRTRLSDTTNSYYRRSRSPKMNRDLIERFKYPLSLSKARLLNSYTPFWKSQKKLGIGQATTTQIRTPGRLPETTRAVIEKCIRLDEKKKYEELIKLTTSSFMRKSNSNKPSIFDFNNSRQRIQALKSLILSKSDDSLSTDAKLQNGAMDKGTPEEVSATVVLSDSDPDQAASADDASTSSSVRIVRVNSLKQSYKEKPVASSALIDKLNEKYGSKEVEKKQEEKYVIFESTTQSKLNREFDLMKKEHFIKALRIDLTVESEEREEVPLPELTDEQHAIINNALRPNPPNQVLIEKFNLSITRRDISTLAGLTWLNDEVINFYMNLIMERCQQKKDLPKVYGMNTFFYPKLMQTGHSGLKRWTRKVDIFSHDLIVAPIHLGIHWCMSIIDFRNKTVKYFESMGGNNMECCDALVKYLEEECMDKKKTKFDTSDWKKECVKDIPQQMNEGDCGMFSCTFAEFIARDVPITFSQSDMPYLRRKMVLEIVQGKLLL